MKRDIKIILAVSLINWFLLLAVIYKLLTQLP
jgi:hypothetical protein